jgi:hypothetical protein
VSGVMKGLSTIKTSRLLKNSPNGVR